jgi:hypothetical protein
MFPRRIHMSRVMRVYACKNCLTFHHLLTTNSKIIKVVGKCLLIVLANNHGKCLFHTSRIFSLHGHDEQLLLAVSKKTFIISCNSLCIPSLSSSSPWLFFFANYTIHRRHSQRTHTHPYEYTHANPTNRSIFEDCAGESSRLTSHHRRLAVDGNVAYHWKHKRR